MATTNFNSISIIGVHRWKRRNGHNLSLPLKNVDPIPVLSVSGTIDPKQDFFNQTTVDAFAYGRDIGTFDASGSYDSDGNIIVYEWILDEENNKDTGPIVSHSYVIDDRQQCLPT